MTVDEKSIFLVDGIGAAFTALSLGVLLPLVPEWIGLPAAILHILGAIGALYGIYSLSRYFMGDTRNPIWLRMLMIANLAYCVLTGTLVGLQFAALKPLGHVYFTGEIAIIVMLVAVEYRVYRRAFRPA